MVVDRPEPSPAAGEVLIDVAAIGVGGVDAVIRRGTIGDPGFRPGMVPGSEVAGTVVAVGGGVDPAWTGTRVWAFTGVGGAYAERVSVPVGQITALPDDLSTVDAVTVGSAGGVAHFALAHAHARAGESVLVRGAAGTLGILMVQLAARAGAGTVAVTTSSAERGARLRGLGATTVLDRSGAGEGPDGYDVVLDIVGGADQPAFLQRLNPNGRLVAVGMVAGFPPPDFGTALLTGFRKSLTFATFSADTVPADERQTLRAAQFAAVARGELASVVHEVLPLDDAALAHRKMDDGEVFGRIVLTP